MLKDVLASYCSDTLRLRLPGIGVLVCTSLRGDWVQIELGAWAYLARTS